MNWPDTAPIPAAEAAPAAAAASATGPTTGPTTGATTRPATGPTTEPAPRAAARRPIEWLVAHARGELSLPCSFWLNYALPSALTSLAIGALATGIHLAGEALRAAGLALLVTWPLAVLIEAWGATGAWRAAGAHLRRGGTASWAHAARAALLLLSLASLASVALNFVPRLGELVQLAQGADPRGQVQAELSADGRALRLRGHLGMGDAERVQQLLARSGGVQRLELDSAGGRFHEARLLAEALRAKG